jgi:hypothetical protein
MGSAELPDRCQLPVIGQTCAGVGEINGLGIDARYGLIEKATMHATDSNAPNAAKSLAVLREGCQPG